MSSTTRGQQIQVYCEIIWGKADYDIDIETDDWVSYVGIVKKDFGTAFGPPLTITGLCKSSEHVWKELDRMLGTWARHKQTGLPMTNDQKLDIFGGPYGQNRGILETFLAVKQEKGLESA